MLILGIHLGLEAVRFEFSENGRDRGCVRQQMA